MESTEASYAASTPDISFEQRILKAGNTPEPVAVLQEFLVIDPLRRPSISELLAKLCYRDSSNPTTQSEPASE